VPDTELAEELLQIEEADAWFEYLESTRGQNENRYHSSSRGPGLVSASVSVPFARDARAFAPPRPEPTSGSDLPGDGPLIALRQAHGR
jgi:hypothetical protein